MIENKFKAVIFDLDGVITKTALVHSVAWKEMFDTYLKQREATHGEKFVEFTHEGDYLIFVDGKPRYEGVKSFLESRGIELPYGEPSDDVEQETYCGVGNRKNIAFNNILERDGIQEYESTVKLMHRLKAEGIKIGVASSSKNAEKVLTVTGLIDLVETRVDGVVSAELGLNGKPAPDIFTTAADNLGVAYHEAVVIEDAISGVQAGKAGNFGLVLGLAREENAEGLWEAGADIVVEDISEIEFEGIQNWFENGLDDDNWSLSYSTYNPEKERSREALLSVGNGYFGTRGAFAFAKANEHNYAGTYMAGLFNKLTSKVEGKDIVNEDFVNIPNWLPITFKIEDGEWFDINNTEILDIERTLYFENGIFETSMLVKDGQGRETVIFSSRFASMDNKNVGGIDFAVSPQNYSGKITIKSTLEGAHKNDGVARYSSLEQQHLEPISQNANGNIQLLTVKTTQSNVYISEAARLEVSLMGEPVDADFVHSSSDGVIESIVSIDVEQEDSLYLSKTVWIEKSDSEIAQKTLLEKLANLADFSQLLDESTWAWDDIWDEVDMVVQGDRITQKMLRLHTYHLLTGTSPHNEDIDFGIPARALTGEAYRGHIFWDELYILPVYFVHYPEVAKSVLMYRFRRLNEARKYAKEFGFKGAMFPWQSGSDGSEETQKFHYNPLSDDWGDDYSSLQRHVSLAIAYNIIQYFHFTNDTDFIEEAGLEILLEIARFWESKSEFNTETGRYSIDKVMGPDEFHEAYADSKEGGIKDNAYTNVMTVWMFDQIKTIWDGISDDKKKLVSNKIDFSSSEIEKWSDISQKMNLVISDEGIISQYDGYFDLEELDWDYYAKKYENTHRMDRVLKAEGKSPDDYKVAKQADTLMLYYNLSNDKVTEIINGLGYKLPEDYIQKNLEYYLQRTSHGSTLSRVVHSYLAQQIGQEELSWSMFQNALTSDYNDIQGGTTAEGVHTGVMAGTLWIMYAAFAGIDFSGDVLSINPNLPKHWTQLAFGLDFKGARYQFHFENGEIEISCDKAREVVVQGKVLKLEAVEIKGEE